MLNLSVADVLALGIDLEQKGAEFYARAALQAEDGGCKDLLGRLHKMELGHEQRLASWYDSLCPTEKTTGRERIAEAQLILSTLALGPFLQFKMDPNIRLAGTESLEQILQIGIGLEENAISLFSALANLVPPGVERDKAEAMRAEECKHRQMLTEQLVVLQLRTQVRSAAKQGLLSRLVGRP